jgi:hypothetical protein
MIQLLFFLYSISLFAQDKYYGAESTEALLNFHSKIIINTKVKNITELRKSPTLQKRVQEEVRYQLDHLIGHFSSASFLKSFGFPGVMGQKYDVKFNKIESTEQGVILNYTFNGKINFSSKAFKGKSKILVPLRMPFDPQNIYELSLKGDSNTCTDPNYNSEGDFFYFWDPDKTDCDLKNNSTDVLRFEAKLTKINNTKLTYPEYDRLYKIEQSNPELLVSIFIGYIDEFNSERAARDDHGFYTYSDLVLNLKDKGFEQTEKQDRVQLAEKEWIKGINYFSSFSRTVKTNLGNEVTVKINLLLSKTEPNETDTTFPRLYVKALKESDLVAYDGHSGLGANLSFDYLPRFSFKSNYQILFLNGCSSYPYFNQNYFEKKPNGSKDMEIITSGLSTLTSTSTSNMMAFLNPFLDGKTISYQTLLNAIEKSNGGEATYLMGVNGDEDNSFKPKK